MIHKEPRSEAEQTNLDEGAEFLAVIDDVIGLPAKQVTPYWLWFNFLKVTCTDPNLKVDRGFYKMWEPYEDIDFIQWWPAHAHLFKVAVGVRRWETAESSIPCPDSEIIVRVPLCQNKKQSLREISQMLDDCGAGSRLYDMKQGLFGLSVGVSPDGRPVNPATRFLRNLNKMKLYFWIYFWWLRYESLDDARRLEETTVFYCEFARIIREPGRFPTEMEFELPHALTAYAEYLKARGTRKRLSLNELNESDVANSRRQVARYVRKARRIATNVSRGEFPGDYE